MRTPPTLLPSGVSREELYRSFFERNPDAVFSLDQAGYCTEVNPAAERLTGYAQAELVGRNFSQILAPEELPRMQAEFAKGLAGDTAVAETTIARKDGTRRRVVVWTVPVLAGGAVVGVFGSARDITEQKSAEESLRESVEQYRTLAENSPIIIDRFDRELRHLYVNAMGLRLHQRPATEVIGKTIAETGVPQPFCRQWEERLRRVFDTGQPLDVEDIFPTPEGARCFLSRCVPERDAAGGVRSVLVVSSDVTAQRETARALRENEERYRLMVEAIPMMAWKCDAAGLLIEANNRWYEYTGQTREEARGHGWMAALHPDDRAQTLQKVKDDVAGGLIYQTEYRLRRAMDGRYRWHLARALPVKDAQGNILSWFGCAADIDDQKRVEEHLEALVIDRMKDLSDSELKFRTLAEQIPAVTYLMTIVDQPCHMLYVSPQIQELLGLDAAAFMADPDLWRKVLHPEDRPRVMNAVTHLRAHGGVMDIEYRLLHRNGEIVWVRDRATLVRHLTQTPAKVQEGVLLDITPRKTMEQQVLAISEREQRRIAQDLHDGLCQHLSGIAFMAGALEQQLATRKLPERKQAARLAQLLDDAVQQARRTARGLFPVNVEAGGLSEALQNLAIQVRELFGTACRFHCPQPVTVADQTTGTHLYRIAQEAVNNALRHGRPKLISLGLTQRAGQLRLTVRDNGRGLPQGKAPATGMGLAVMRHRADLIGATVTIQNVRPHGVLVTCRLDTHIPVRNT